MVTFVKDINDSYIYDPINGIYIIVISYVLFDDVAICILLDNLKNSSLLPFYN